MSKAFSSRRGLTLIELIGTILVIGVLLVFLVPEVTRSREAARRSQCKNNLKQIYLALQSYHNAYRVFPPAYTVDAHGKPLHSWRSLILPYLDQKPLYDSIDLSKPWNDPVNNQARKTEVAVYGCPAAYYSRDNVLNKKTSYLAVVTPQSCLRPAKSCTLREIVDGTPNTLLVVEVDPKYAVEWMSPKDAAEEIILKRGENPERTFPHMGGAHAVLADGGVKFLSENMSRKDLHALTTINGGEEVRDY